MNQYKLNRINGMNQLDAALAAGYSEKYAKQACRIEKLVKVSLTTHLERAGVTEKKLAKKIAEGLEATKLCGINDVEHPDYLTQHKYLQTSLELKGLVSDPRANNGQAEALHIRVLNIINNYNVTVGGIEVEEKKTIDIEAEQKPVERSGVTIA